MHKTLLKNILELKKTYDSVILGKESLLKILLETELPEAVYNSNAIENSTLTLDITEKILLENIMPAHHSRREIFEAINLGRVYEYLDSKDLSQIPLTHELITFLHATLLHGIDDTLAGRYRTAGEYVRVGSHIAPPPEEAPQLMNELLSSVTKNHEDILERIVYFHLEFERIHPFCDGNGRIGRVLVDFLLRAHGYPPIIIKNRDKKNYYAALGEYSRNRLMQPFEIIFGRLIKESLHKRITYCRGDTIVPLHEIARLYTLYSPQSLTNAAKKQSLPAFRERGKWKIGEKMFQDWSQR